MIEEGLDRCGSTYIIVGTYNLIVHDLGQFLCVCQIAIVCDANTVGIVGIERLRLGTTAGPRRRISHMANAHVSTQFQHMMLLKNVLHETIILPKVKTTAFGSNDSSGILAAVLKDSEAVKEHLVDLEIDWNTDSHKLARDLKSKAKLFLPLDQSDATIIEARTRTHESLTNSFSSESRIPIMPHMMLR